MELLLVMAVVAAIAAMGFPIWNSIRNRSNIGVTRVWVQAIATAISGYSTQFWTVMVPDPSDPTPLTPSKPLQPRIGRIWDLNGSSSMDGDGYIDGHPALVADKTHDGPFWDAVIKSGYTGFTSMIHPAIQDKRLLNDKGQPLDAWGTPMHIAFATDTYGASWFGVWSSGPDKKSDKSQPQTLVDDICSWKNADEQ